jgi:glucose-6-phosphate isomerase
MTDASTSLTLRPAWNALVAHHEQVRNLHLRTLFANDPGRGERLTVEAAGLFFDYSKNRVTDESLTLLVQLAKSQGCAIRIGARCSAA